MSYTFKKGQLRVKDSDGNYQSVNVVADQTTQQGVASINQAKQNALDDIDESVNESLTQLTTLKNQAETAKTGAETAKTGAETARDEAVSAKNQIDTDLTGKANVGDSYTKEESDTKYLTEHQDISGKMDKSALLDAGIKSISWSTVLEGTFTTVEDPRKSQRPSGTNTRYYVDIEKSDFMNQNCIYRITFNGTKYENLYRKHGITISLGSNETTLNCLIGNRNLYDSRYEDNNIDFCLLQVGHDIGSMSPYYYTTANHLVIFTRSAETVSIKIEKGIVQYDSLPKQLSAEQNYNDDIVEKYGNSSYCRTSLGCGNIAGRASIAIGHSAISNGYVSVAENTSVAKGDYSHSSGYISTASGYASHAEGNNTTASGNSSHAECCETTASGMNSHAEGYKTKSTGESSHAEGFGAESKGKISHSEGYYTIANGNYSHVQGIYNISDDEQSVFYDYDSEPTETYFSVRQSPFNIKNYLSSSNMQIIGTPTSCKAYPSGADVAYEYDEDTGIITLTNGVPSYFALVFVNVIQGIARGKYSHIVGNGSANTSRSNAHTLDWDGNAWYQGDVYVGGTSQSDATKLVKESDLSSKLTKPSTGIEVGKYFRVASIDELGNPVLEYCDAPNTDVQINGTSIVQDGVANIPYGSATNFGLQKFLPDYGFDVSSGDSCVRVMNASSDDISRRRTDIRRTIQPMNIDYAVKAALTDGKGQAYTDAEKQSACERLGAVHDGKFELIETITLESSDTWVREAEPNGTPYNFSDVFVYITIPSGADISECAGYERVQFYNAEGQYLNSDCGIPSKNTYNNVSISNFMTSNGMAMVKYTRTQADGNSTISWNTKLRYLSGWCLDFGPCTKIRLNKNDKEPIGTIIKIYGIRA